MTLLLWDASALAKNYVPETGSATTVALFSAVPTSQMAITVVGYIETVAMLVRKRNGKLIKPKRFAEASARLRLDVVEDPAFTMVEVDTLLMLGSVGHILRHSLNSSDAVVLHAFLEYVRLLPPGAGTPILISADGRLRTAANAEGLTTIDPEAISPLDALALLASLS